MNLKYEAMLKGKLSALSIDYRQKNKNIEYFFCIDGNNDNLSLFYYPNNGSSSINLDNLIKNNGTYTLGSVSIIMIYGNNLINHNEKRSPILEVILYQFIQDFSFNEETVINFHFQYLNSYSHHLNYY